MGKIIFLKLMGVFCLLLGSIQNAYSDTQNQQIAAGGILPQEIIDAQPAPLNIREGLCQRAFEDTNKTTYELIPTYEGLDFSLAVSDVIESAPHYHNHLIETYTGVYGTIEVFIDDKSYLLNPGDVIVIPKNSIHYVRSVNGEVARIIVGCVPGWSSHDNHQIDDPAYTLIKRFEEKLSSRAISLTTDDEHPAIVGVLESQQAASFPLKDIPSHLFQRRFELPTKVVPCSLLRKRG